MGQSVVQASSLRADKKLVVGCRFPTAATALKVPLPYPLSECLRHFAWLATCCWKIDVG